GAPVLVALFLFPLFPGDALCYAAGLSTMRGRVFLAAAFVGRFPKFVLYTMFGDRFATAGLRAAAPYLLPLALASGLVYWKKESLIHSLQ
ncbi:MAG: TVP38/TMEM64 family protein, partial [Candidatus Nanohaloarchaea archaeon]|nr:TVP38/TMEM64 family protein [Candidatus Nanohaloarchaea archaeon]